MEGSKSWTNSPAHLTQFAWSVTKTFQWLTNPILKQWMWRFGDFDARNSVEKREKRQPIVENNSSSSGWMRWSSQIENLPWHQAKYGHFGGKYVEIWHIFKFWELDDWDWASTYCSSQKRCSFGEIWRFCGHQCRISRACPTQYVKSANEKWIHDKEKSDRHPKQGKSPVWGMSKLTQLCKETYLASQSRSPGLRPTHRGRLRREKFSN